MVGCKLKKWAHFYLSRPTLTYQRHPQMNRKLQQQTTSRSPTKKIPADSYDLLSETIRSEGLKRMCLLQNFYGKN
jgi:hypothetical protein